MKCITVFLVIVNINLPKSFGIGLQKCCNNGQQVKDMNSTWSCAENSNKRLQSTFENNNFFEGNTNGSCIETVLENKTAIFFVDESEKISKKQDIEVDFFSKCCHLGRSYDRKLHSCSRTETTAAIEKNIPKNSFVSVGLPHCKIISDIVVPSLGNFSWTLNSTYLTQINRNLSKGNYCIDSTLDSKFIVRICEEDFQICERIRCIHKCCSDGQSFVNGSKCRDTFRYGVDLHRSKYIEEPDSPFAIIHGFHRPLGILRKNIFKINSDGVFSSYILSTDSYEEHPVTTVSYCIEHAYKKAPGNRTLDNYEIFVKIVEQEIQEKISIARWVQILSCIFLLLTILVYVILPKLRNLFGKILLSYCVATFATFSLLTITQFFHYKFSVDFCKVVGFSLILSSFWSFTWMHIICIDIWLSFGSSRTLSGPLQRNERKRLLQYSLYGWVFPLLWVLLIAFFNGTEILPSSLHPYVGVQKCYIEDYHDRKGNYAFSLFITLPIVIQQTVNIVLFVKTITYCIRIKNEIKRMDENTRSPNDYSAGKEKLYLILKLGVVMGMLFLFDTISSIWNFNVNPVTKRIEIVWDTINCLQGVFIFIIFIFKRKIKNDLCEKWKMVRGYSLTSSTLPSSIQSELTKEEFIYLDQKK